MTMNTIFKITSSGYCSSSGNENNTKIFLDLPKFGFINLHALYCLVEGAAPIQRSIMNPQRTGVSFMKIQENDTGPYMLQIKLNK